MFVENEDIIEMVDKEETKMVRSCSSRFSTSRKTKATTLLLGK